MSSTTQVRPTRHRRAVVIVGRVAVPLILVGLWAVAASLSDLVPGVLASLDYLVSGLIDGSLHPDLSASAQAVVSGFLVAAVTAVPAGIVLARNRYLRDMFDPVIAGLFAVPRIILYPMMLGFFGLGVTALGATGAISAFFPIVISTSAAMRSVSATLIKLGQSFNLSRTQLFVKILLPATAPSIMAGLRVGFGVSFITVIISEFFAARDGLGKIVSDSYALGHLPAMYGVIVLILVMALAGNLLLWVIEHRIHRWSSRGSA